jgi:hypothetical protein
MSVTLESLATCFQGILPSQLFTCSQDGMPNAAYLSHVDYVDSSHVALSFQFFNKSRRNISENPQAFVMVLDPDTGQGWQLRLRFVRSETEGPLFERMALRIEAIASYCGLKGIFKLLAADVYQVLSIDATPEEPGLRTRHGNLEPLLGAPDPVFTMKALQDLAGRIHGAHCLETLVDAILEGLEESFGFKYSMILVPGEEPHTLVAIATRGYAQSGIGAEMRYGEGIGGMVAEARKPIRISGLMRGMLYAYAMHAEGRDPHARRRPRIPVPGLENPESLLGVPLLVRGELVGVLCLESEEPYRFHEEDKASIELLGSYLAIAIQNMQLQEQSEGVAAASPESAPEPRVAAPASVATPPNARELTYYEADECVLVDGEYLIRSLPAKILWKLLTTYHSTGRREFTNRELRMDRTLNLPEFKDNLESRLILLRRRLEQKCPDIRLVSRARGRFALEIDGDVTLVTRS